ncbi:MAG: hypothetical protein CL608_25920 [Anaerolineaceae bacterium]|nr:hypothetical protein [Anaerolineaceae bacterium]
MQATTTPDVLKLFRRRKVGYFMIPPVTTTILFLLIPVFALVVYQSQYRGRIPIGVSLWRVDLSGMTLDKAEEALAETFPYQHEKAIVFTDPQTGQAWQMSPAELGLAFDAAATAAAAYQVGRSGPIYTQLWQLFSSWYYGRSLSPVIVLDEGQLNAALTELAAEINRPAVNAKIEFAGSAIRYTPAQVGRRLDVTDARTRLLMPLTRFRQADVELLIQDVMPTIYDPPAVTAGVQQMISNEPVTFYVPEPLDAEDLTRVELTPATLKSWIRAEVIEQADGSRRHRVLLDENAVRQWLSTYAEMLYREPVNARYYFDDVTKELVLVTPHVNGRELDVEATLALLQEQIGTANRSIPFVVNQITPAANSKATAAGLGITELISERTTWFYGSSDARKRNIAQAAANFYGIVIAPGEEFSFNKYLGSISEADGYEEGLIIVGGQTIKGIGGGVCQVSTTVFQTVFYAGFPVTERWQHGYMLGYYNDGEGPGMDATVYDPIVDFKFINNTPYYLLIENYYNEIEESLTFKFYSTGMGRRVEKSGPVFGDIVPAPPQSEDVWQFDPDMESGTVRQIDWATEGATVTVGRTVYNADGQIILQEDFVSNYVPWPGGYMYGPGVNAPDYSLVPEND